MTYARESTTREQRQRLLEEVTEEVMKRYIDKQIGAIEMRADEWTHDKWRKILMDEFHRMARNYLRAKDAIRGVDTRLGTHDRVMKMRHGLRVDERCESYTWWYVLRRDPGWFKALEEDADAQSSDDDPMPGEEWWDLILQTVAPAVKQEYGDEPYPHGINAAWSPTGWWFSNVGVKQVGRRVLVTWQHQQDV